MHKLIAMGFFGLFIVLVRPSTLVTIDAIILPPCAVITAAVFRSC